MQAYPLVAASVILGSLATAAAQPPRQAVPAGTTTHRDLAYIENGHERQKLDLYLPAKAESPTPVIVWIHGGAWLAGSKKMGSPALPFVTEGYAVASINYRLSQHATFPAQIQDCQAAIRWLRAHADEYNLDPDRLAVWGASAGGHLVALVGTAGDASEWDAIGSHTDQSSEVQAVIDWFGPTDFMQMGGNHDNPDSPEAKLIGGAIQSNQDKSARANPITYVDADDPPLLVFHGSADRVVPVGQSELLEAAVTKAGGNVTLHVLDGAGHGGPQFDSEENTARVREFLGTHLGK